MSRQRRTDVDNGVILPILGAIFLTLAVALMLADLRDGSFDLMQPLIDAISSIKIVPPTP